MHKPKRRVLVEGRGRNRSTGRTVQFRLFKPRVIKFDSGSRDHTANKRAISELREKVEIEEIQHYNEPVYVLPEEWDRAYLVYTEAIRNPYFPFDPFQVAIELEQGNWSVLSVEEDKRAKVKIGNETVILNPGDLFVAVRRLEEPPNFSRSARVCNSQYPGRRILVASYSNGDGTINQEVLYRMSMDRDLAFVRNCMSPDVYRISDSNPAVVIEPMHRYGSFVSLRRETVIL